jgi:DHA2 family multidrug resistance protein
MINVARNVGGSIGVSIAQNVLAHREQFHMSRLVETTIPSTIQYQEALKRAQDYFLSAGSSASQAQRQAMQWIGRQIATQSSLLAYIDVFATLMVLALLVIPLSLILRRSRAGAKAAVAH